MDKFVNGMNFGSVHFIHFLSFWSLAYSISLSHTHIHTFTPCLSLTALHFHPPCSVKCCHVSKCARERALLCSFCSFVLWIAFALAVFEVLAKFAVKPHSWVSKIKPETKFGVRALHTRQIERYSVHTHTHRHTKLTSCVSCQKLKCFGIWF